MKIIEGKGWTNAVVLDGAQCARGSVSHTVPSTRSCPQAVWCAWLRRTAVCTFVRFSHARLARVSADLFGELKCSFNTVWDTPVSFSHVVHTTMSYSHGYLSQLVCNPVLGKMLVLFKHDYGHTRVYFPWGAHGLKHARVLGCVC
ncbi:hypothetical protein GOBAR_AA35583 [Gossypium barbadense]|uniref:Uncharacterized protein n=1 Tax=Gossypium barbadense TaxID=3634 RepID=A0A2P5W214_GOSBA|nr:hypothetical protein GOBAR_AA35583 [Gossypium barbadense]